jgi:hypothetical protein
MYDTIDEIKTLVFETFAILADYSDSRCYEVESLEQWARLTVTESSYLLSYGPI